jgi:hypothetical protein
VEKWNLITHCISHRARFCLVVGSCALYIFPSRLVDCQRPFAGGDIVLSYVQLLILEALPMLARIFGFILPNI